MHNAKHRDISRSLRKLISKEVMLKELDIDFLEYDLYDIPYFKILK